MDAPTLERLNSLLDHDAEMREKIKEHVNKLDKKSRTMMGLLNTIHSTPLDGIPTILTKVCPMLASCKEDISSLASVIPEHQFWRWKDMWTNSLRNIIFVALLAEYLSTRKLLSLPDAAELIGIRPESCDRVALPVEDYLHSVISVVNELSRLATNSVTLGNFDEPMKISTFAKDLFAGFSMLNLKNDALRRRYDSLKYDIKRIEEVVYDVSLRNLTEGPLPTFS